MGTALVAADVLPGGVLSSEGATLRYQLIDDRTGSERGETK